MNYGSNINHLFFLSAGAKAFVCDQCGAQFSKEDALETHRQTHTGECPPTPFPELTSILVQRRSREFGDILIPATVSSCPRSLCIGMVLCRFLSIGARQGLHLGQSP